jgi:hypothetical protein
LPLQPENPADIEVATFISTNFHPIGFDREPSGLTDETSIRMKRPALAARIIGQN